MSDVHVFTLTFKRLSQHDTKACFPAPKESASSVCSQEVTACFILLVSVANHLPGRLVKQSEEMASRRCELYSNLPAAVL